MNNETRYTTTELRKMAKDRLDTLLPLIAGQDITADFLRRLSSEIPQEHLGLSGFFIEVNGEPAYDHGRQCEGCSWDGNPDTLKFFRIEEFTGLLGYIYFNVKDGKASLSGFDIFNMHRDAEGNWCWDDEAEPDNDSVQYSSL